MSVSPTPVNLRGSRLDERPLKLCSKCAQEVSPAGGCEMGPARWICGKCWKGRFGFGK